MAEAASPFFWGSGGERLTPAQVERKRKVAEALAKQGGDYSPVQHWTQGAARVAQALVGGWEDRKASEAEKANEAESAGLLTGLLGGGKPSVDMPAAAIPGPAESTANPAAAVAKAPADLLPRFAQAEVQYGLPRNFLAQTANIESRFDPNAKNPSSSASGLFQFTRGTARDYGLTNPMDPVASTDAAARLAADNAKVLTRTLGRAPTAGELYLAHQQGAGGASKLLSNPNARAIDIVGPEALRLNGGHDGMSAGEFAKRWTSKLAANEADMPAPDAMPAEAPGQAPGFVVPPGEQPAPAMTPETFNAIASGEPPLDPVFQTEGVAQPWMGTAIAPQPVAPQVAQAPMPPPRPADLPAPGAVEAIGQMPPQAAPQPQMMPDLSNSPDGGMRQLQVLSEQARQGQAPAPEAPLSPFQRVAAAFTGGGTPAAPAAAQNPAVAAVAQAVSQNPSDPLVRALTSPYANEATKKVAMAMLLKRIEGDNKPPIAVGKDQRLVDPRTGRVILDRDRNASDVRRSLTPVYGTDAQGNTVLLQPSEDGTAGMMKLPPGVKIANGIDKIDTGTEFILQDKRTGQVVGRQAKDLAGAEAAKVEGKAAGEAKTGLSGALATAEQSLKTIEDIRNHPGRDSWGAQGGTAAWPIIGDGIPGTKGRDFVVLVDQLKGKAFLEAFQSLKGGGAITEAEGAKAQAAIARLDRAQSREGFDAALKDLEDVIRGGVARAKAKAGQGSGTAPPPAVDTTKPGNFRFNPATGKMESM